MRSHLYNTYWNENTLIYFRTERKYNAYALLMSLLLTRSHAALALAAARAGRIDRSMKLRSLVAPARSTYTSAHTTEEFAKALYGHRYGFGSSDIL